MTHEPSQSAADASDPAPPAPDDMPVLRLELPPVGELLRPDNQFRWFKDFAEGWLLSRGYSRLLAGIPFLCVALGGTAYVWWLHRAPQHEMIAGYERAADAAIQEGRPEDAALYLQSLVQQRPYEERYRFQLALHLLQQDRVGAAVAQMRQMTSLEKRGYVPARLWLAEQARSSEPVVPVSGDEALAQLLKAIEEQSDNVDAHQMLAELYLQQRQLRQAETALRQVVDARPELALLLAKVQQQIGRTPEQVNSALQTARVRFEQRVLQNPRDDAARAGWSETLQLTGQDAEAEAVLLEGLRHQNSAVLNQALSQLYSGLASRRLQESVLNRDLSSRLVVRALQARPDNAVAVRQLLQLAAAGASVSAEDVRPALEYWQQMVTAGSADLGNRLLLIQLLEVSGDRDAAIKQLQAIVDEAPTLRLMLARLYLADQRQAEADQLLDTLLQEQQAELDDNPTATQVGVHAETLLAAGRLQQARKVLQSALDDSDPADQQTQMLQSLAGQTLLAIYDQRRSANTTTDSQTSSDDESESLIQLLQQALDTAAVRSAVTERLARLSCSADPLAPQADRLLNRLLAEGTGSVQVYTYVGTCALEASQPQKARMYLERAYALDSQNPMVLNNLALALVRESADNSNRALTYTNEALQQLPNHPDVLSTRAEVLMSLQRWEEARRDLELALPQDPSSKTIRQLLVTVCDQLNETELADEHRRILKEQEG